MGSSSSKPVAKRVPIAGEQSQFFGGLLTRIFKPDTCEWWFYNGSPDYQFRVTYLFGSDCNVQPAKNVTATQQDDGLLCVVVVEPMSTALLVTGALHTYESKYEALPLSEEYFSLHPEKNEKEYMRRLNPPKAEEF